MNNAELMAVLMAGTAVQDRHADAGRAAAGKTEWETAHSEMDKAIGASEATGAIISALSATMQAGDRE